MGKITEFNWQQFWRTQEKYNDMMCAIEDRAFEIAQYLGRREQKYQITDVFFSHDNTREYVNVEFSHGPKGEEGSHEYFKFDVDWLFSDDYKEELAAKEAHKKAEEERTYLEYLRLKELFEGKK